MTPAPPPAPPPVVPIIVQAKGPYEDAIIAGFKVIEKLIDGQTPAVKAQLWAQWIAFWAPLIKLGTDVNTVFHPGIQHAILEDQGKV